MRFQGSRFSLLMMVLGWIFLPLLITPVLGVQYLEVSEMNQIGEKFFRRMFARSQFDDIVDPRKQVLENAAAHQVQAQRDWTQDIHHYYEMYIGDHEKVLLAALPPKLEQELRQTKRLNKRQTPFLVFRLPRPTTSPERPDMIITPNFVGVTSVNNVDEVSVKNRFLEIKPKISPQQLTANWNIESYKNDPRNPIVTQEEWLTPLRLSPPSP